MTAGTTRLPELET